MRRSRTDRRGLGLVEILLCIVLVSVVALLSARLLRTTQRLYRDAPAATATIRSQAQWLRQMRDDAWQARTIATQTPGRLVLSGDAKAIRWQAEGGTLTRTEGDDERRWPIEGPISWRRVDRTLTLVADAEVPLATPSLSPSEAR
jgi:type II secretory pathway component PulJ